MQDQKREKDPQQEPPLVRCSYCGGEIYEGGLYYVIGRHKVCKLCLGRYAAWFFLPCLRIAGRRGPQRLFALPAEEGGAPG